MIFADSRAFADEFTGVTIKCNDKEARSLVLGPQHADDAFSHSAMSQCQHELRRRTGKRAVITCGSRGVLVEQKGASVLVPALPAPIGVFLMKQFMEQIRIIKEMRTAERERGRTGVQIRPRYMAWENVPGAFSSGSPKGEDFRIVLEEILRIHHGGASVPRSFRYSWPDAGVIEPENTFSLAWRCLDAQYWGVAQRRKRIFLVADFAGDTAPKLLFDVLEELLPDGSEQSEGGVILV